MAGPPPAIVNGDFEQGLTGWRVVSGKAFSKQPVEARTIGAAQVQIGGKPAATLGGDFWHTTSYPLGANKLFLIRAVTKAPGILDSVPFKISRRFLVFRLGGSRDKGAAIELRVTPKAAQRAGLKVLDKPDAEGYVAVKVAIPAGSDVLKETAWDLGAPTGKTLIGQVGKVRLRLDANARTARRLLVDHVRLMHKRPARFRPPVWGWADIHCHPMAQAGFGELLHGHMHGPVEDVGSCLELHGHMHQNLLRPASVFLEGKRHNDGSLQTSGWTTLTPEPDDQLAFRGWPAFDERTHLKTHQDWIRRAYDGGQRLMVALIVHNQMLASISTATQLLFAAQSDRDTVEPQVRMLREFVAHNGAWCGIATTPVEARNLIEANRLAFVLGLETDSINDWVHDADLPSDPTAVHAAIHDYFAYLQKLGVVQVNLIHLTDNAFGGMALYSRLFMINSFTRRGVLPDVENGWTAHPVVEEKISAPVDIATVPWEHLEPEIQKLGFQWPAILPAGAWGQGHRNKHGLTAAGRVALNEAMRLGMVVDMDHMSERAIDQAFLAATKVTPEPYPLISAHNGARAMAPRPPATRPGPMDLPQPDERRNHEAWPSENMKSETQLGYIKTTKGMFGHGIAGADSRSYGMVDNNCAGTSRTVAQGLDYVSYRLGENDQRANVAFGTDWNALLGGPAPRFGPMAGPGVVGEYANPDDAWTIEVRSQRLTGALAQDDGVTYRDGPRDWGSHRFRDTGLFRDTSLFDPNGLVGDEGRFLWQGVILRNSGQNLDDGTLPARLRDPILGYAPALELARGLAGLTSLVSVTPATPFGSDFHRAAVIVNANGTIPATGENQHVQDLVGWLPIIQLLWRRMTGGPAATAMDRSTAGPKEFDYNLDGLAHYGMLPDLLQDLKNVELPQPVLDGMFRSAEEYLQVWERSVKAAATIPHPAPGTGP